jgi:hypothetical protein
MLEFILNMFNQSVPNEYKTHMNNVIKFAVQNLTEDL